MAAAKLYPGARVGEIVDMGADEYYWTKTIAIVKTPGGIEISWDCLPGVRYYRVDYADALGLGMTWNAFPEIIDGFGLERVSYLDTMADQTQMRFYRIREHQ